MKIKFSSEVDKAIAQIERRDKKLGKRIEKQLTIFSVNPRHPSLRLHKLTGQQKDTWSISITMSVRMIYIVLEKNTAYFTSIGAHDQVYDEK